MVSGTPRRAPERAAQAARRGLARLTARAGGSTSRPRSGSSSASPSTQGTRGAGRRRSPTTSSASSLLNDWSARDIQAWEYAAARPVPGQVLRDVGVGLGDPAGRAGRGPGGPRRSRTRRRCPTCVDAEPWALDLALEVELDGEVVSRPPFAGMYWTPGQQLAHLTVNGASLRTGDLFASGTVSGAERERARLVPRAFLGRPRAAQPCRAVASVTFLEDGDEVVLRATAHRRWTAAGSASARSRGTHPARHPLDRPSSPRRSRRATCSRRSERVGRAAREPDLAAAGLLPASHQSPVRRFRSRTRAPRPAGPRAPVRVREPGPAQAPARAARPRRLPRRPRRRAQTRA